MNNTESFTLRDILKIFFAHKAYFIVFPAVLVLSAYIGTQMRTPMFEASVRMFIKAQKKTESEFYSGVNTRDIVSDHAELVKSNTVLSRVVRAMSLDKRPVDYERRFASKIKRLLIDSRLKNRPSFISSQGRFAAAMNSLYNNVSVTPIGMSNLFYIKVTDFDPQQAMLIANSVSRSYVIFDLEQQIEEVKLKYGEKHSSVLQLKDYAAEFEKTLDGKLIPDLQAIGPASVKIIAQAEGAVMKRTTPASILMLFSFIVGLMLAVSVAAVSEYYDSSVKFSKHLMDQLRLNILGALPKRKRKEKLMTVQENRHSSRYVKSLYSFYERLRLIMKQDNLNVLLITDSEGSEETGILCANLGILAGKSGLRTLIVDADMHAVGINGLFANMDESGLRDVLEAGIPVTDVIRPVSENLFILPSGAKTGDSRVFSASDRIQKLMKELKEGYDFVFILCPHLNLINDAAILSAYSDATAVVINDRQVRRQVLEHALSILRHQKINILGAVFTNRKYVIPEIIYKLT